MRKNQNGFIPMIILLLVLIAGVVYFAYKHVSSAHQKELIQKVQQNENSLSQ